jgi:hypothetical protein
MSVLLKRLVSPRCCYVCFVCLLSSGCGSDFEIQKFSQIEKGMTEQAVVAALGEGREIPWAEVESITKSFPQVAFTQDSCDRWLMWGNRSSYGLVGFQNGKVRELLSRSTVADSK